MKKTPPGKTGSNCENGVIEFSQRSRILKLDKKDQFHRLLPGQKRLMDTIRMIAYRAETAMTGIIGKASERFEGYGNFSKIWVAGEA